MTPEAVGIFSPGLMRLPGLRTFLGARRLVFRPTGWRAARLDAVAGWGHKPTADPARAYARRHGLPYLALEDGFLRSVRLGPAEPPLSLVVDDLGIYYDARGPSRLERMIAEGVDASGAAALRARLRAARVSKYNHAPELPRGWRDDRGGRDDRPVVLVVDQTYDDASVRQGLADASTFDRMLAAARDEHPGARVVVKVHPATVSGLKRGYLADTRLDVERLTAAVHPIALLEQVDHVYVVSSQLGFEALLHDLPVRCFGAPFYAGWGLTRDETALSRRGPRSLDELVAAALLHYPRYRHPLTGEPTDAATVIDHLALQRQMLADNDRRFVCVGFSTWKRPFVRRYLQTFGATAGANVCFRRWPARHRFTEDDAIVVWGARRAAPRATTPSGARVPVWRMEDGFLRSARLGSELSPPGSLVIDRRGLYYDPSRPSDLEVILSEATFSPEELERARRLREEIVAREVTKYNLSAARRFVPRNHDRPVVLVIGQVDDDASVLLGGGAIRDSAALLSAVRRARPAAHIVFRPHPDVLSGNRKRGRPLDRDSYDELVVDASLPACLAAADEVHTLTSLVGFEALLRQIPVTTWGQPFYAGWGLSDDRAPPPRRTRRLTLDELVAGTLLRYPRYYSFRARAFCTPEDMVGELSRARDRARGRTGSTPWLVRRARDVAILSWEWLHDRDLR